MQDEENGSNEQPGAITNDNGAKGDIDPLVVSPSGEANPEPQSNDNDSSGETSPKRPTRKPAFADFVSMASSVSIAFFTGVLMLTGIAQWSTLNRQAEAMENTLSQMTTAAAAQADQFESQLKVAQDAAGSSERASFANRAWLSVQYSGIGEPREKYERAIGRAALIDVQFLIQNHGLTPARIKNLEASIYVVEGDSDPTARPAIQIDPDNPAHHDYMDSELRQVWDVTSGKKIRGFSNDMFLSGGETRHEFMILGNGGSSSITAEFLFIPPDIFFDYDKAEGAPRFDYWLHVEVPYLDVYQIERRTCFFAHVDGSDAFLADHISNERHNYQR